MKTLRELLNYVDLLSKMNSNSDEKSDNKMNRRMMNDILVIHMYMTQDDIDVNIPDMTCRAILDSLHNKRMIRDRNDKPEESSVNNE